MENALLVFFFFAIPAYLLSGLFGLAPYFNMLGPIQFILKISLLAGFTFVLVEFWRTREINTDDKLFWTMGVFFVIPIGLPLLYLMKSNNPKEAQNASNATMK